MHYRIYQLCPVALLLLTVGCDSSRFDPQTLVTSDTRLNTIRYDEYVYDLSDEKCNLSATIMIEDGIASLNWWLDVRGVDSEGDDPAPYYAPHADAFFQVPEISDWRNLVGVSIDEDLGEDPGESVYTGIHSFPDHHQVEFLERRGREFLIHATWDIGIHVDAHGWIPFDGVRVGVDEGRFGDRIRALPASDAKELPPTLHAEIMKHASDALGSHLPLADFGEPEMQRSPFVIWFPLLVR